MVDTKSVLVIFPHAGGNELSYRGLVNLMSPELAAKVVCYPGRGRRMMEPCITSMNLLVEDVLNQLKGWELKPASRLFFLGHSFGALVAFEVMRQMRKKGIRLPEVAFFSGASGPSNPYRDRTRSKKTNAELTQLLGQLGGMEAELLTNADFLEYFLPIFRSDLMVMDGYDYPTSIPFNLPFRLMNGKEDKGVNEEKLALWQMETQDSCTSHFYKGGHFHLFQDSAFAFDLKQMILNQENSSINRQETCSMQSSINS